MAERFLILTDDGYVTDSVPSTCSFNPLKAIYFVTFDAAIAKARVYRELTGIVPTITSVPIPFPRPISYYVSHNHL